MKHYFIAIKIGKRFDLQISRAEKNGGPPPVGWKEVFIGLNFHKVGLMQPTSDWIEFGMDLLELWAHLLFDGMRFSLV